VAPIQSWGNLSYVQRSNGSRVTPLETRSVRCGFYRCGVAERSGDLWASFQHDPRDPSVAPLRASDADRNVVHGILTEAFADGRLDREEYDERTATTLQARTLGELPPLVADLVPDRPLLPAKVPLSAASSLDIQQRAEDGWRKDRRDAFRGFLGSAVVTWVIWSLTALAAGGMYFPWPLIVNAFALLNLLRVVTSRDEMVANEVKRLERKRAKEIEARNKKNQLGP
jgi:uncharacterized membrane protein